MFPGDELWQITQNPFILQHILLYAVFTLNVLRDHPHHRQTVGIQSAKWNENNLQPLKQSGKPAL